MIITRRQLWDIENAIGHSCEAGVLAGIEQGDIAIRVWAERADGELYSCQQELKVSDQKNFRWLPLIEEFKYISEMNFARFFASVGVG